MKKHKHTNLLINETSLYLLQHAHNPVNWYPWSNKTLELAKKENKLILISIGYASCHWCHVMEHEIFENEQVAEIMNKNFICIKVDREERPDIDQIYMDAVQLITGRGGWPLNCVTMPDGKPIWGGTYFPIKTWINSLKQLIELKKNEPEKLEKQANNLFNGIKQSELILLNTDKPNFTKKELHNAINNWKPYIDKINGGKIGSPKFPTPNNYLFLLRYAIQTKNKEILDYVNLTLTKMAFGGINDQIGGGFARYSVDKYWHIPHFEKMLYDNGQLLSLYANAYKATKKELYKETVYNTALFLERELLDKTGAFYSSLDADSLNKNKNLQEGIFYVWTKEELKNLLKKDFNLFADYYNVNEYRKWKNNAYILIRTQENSIFAKNNNLSKEQLELKIKHWKKILLEQRLKRKKPRLDDKILTSWNALTLKGYIDAYKAFNDNRFLEIAIRNANFLEKIQIQPDGSLYRSYKKKTDGVPAYLEDYATVIDAFISLHEITLDEKWLNIARQLTNYTLDYFYDNKSKMFFFTSKLNEKLILKKIEIEDSVIPSSNSVMANNLFKLSYYFNNKQYKAISTIMLNNVKNKIIQHGTKSSNWLLLYSNFISKFYEIAIIGDKAKYKTNKFNLKYIPNIILAGSVAKSNLPLLKERYSKEKTLIYVCLKNTCQIPKEKVEEAFKDINIALEPKNPGLD